MSVKSGRGVPFPLGNTGSGSNLHNTSVRPGFWIPLQITNTIISSDRHCLYFSPWQFRIQRLFLPHHHNLKFYLHQVYQFFLVRQMLMVLYGFKLLASQNINSFLHSKILVLWGVWWYLSLQKLLPFTFLLKINFFLKTCLASCVMTAMSFILQFGSLQKSATYHCLGDFASETFQRQRNW